MTLSRENSMPEPREKKDRRGPRAKALLVQRAPWQPASAGAEFATALAEDLRELISALGLSLLGSPGGVSGPQIRAVVESTRDPLLVFFSDVPALPPLSVEGALDSLKDYGAVLGPCADGSLYLLGLGPELDEKLKVALLEAALVSPGEALSVATDLLCDDEAGCGVLPPWFRIARDTDLRFAENLVRLSLLSDEGDDDVVCDRLRLWFEQTEADALPS